MHRSPEPFLAQALHDTLLLDCTAQVGIFGKFGKKVLEDPEPLGMKRMRQEDFPEMYPATTTEFADPVEGDDEEVAAFRPLLAATQLQEKELMLVYSANDCGWDPDAFHRCVDSMGAAVSPPIPGGTTSLLSALLSLSGSRHSAAPLNGHL